MIGFAAEPRVAELAVEAGMTRYYASSLEDGNPSYWDEDFATEYWGGLIAPPGMIQSWGIKLPWRPDGPGAAPALVSMVPLPGDKPINISTDVEYFQPVKVGDLLTVHDSVVDVSDEKQTAVGRGHFLTTQSEYRNQKGECVARVINILLRYTAVEQQS